MNALLVEDHALFREGLALLMRQRYPAVVLHQAANLAQAQALLARHADIDLVLLDLHRSDSTGLASLKELRRQAPELTIVVLSADSGPETVDAVIAAGGSGFIPKTARGRVIEQALGVVLDGGVYLPTDVLHAARLRGQAWRGQLGATGEFADYAAAVQDVYDLSPRQHDVLRGLIESKSNKAIARDLGIADSSVKSHLQIIFKKLGVASRAEAMLTAMRLGLATNDPD
ncbi:MAG: response regulator transcription factor [Burkholderiales bacterium]